jgi:hypothetical protein
MTVSGHGINATVERRDIDTEFATLREIMESLSFRRSTGTAGEQAFYIYDYPATQEIEVHEHILLLVNQLQTMTPKTQEDFAPKVLVIDLYDVALGILERRGVLRKVLDIETKRHVRTSANPREDKFLSLLDNMLGADAKQLPDAIRDRYQSAKNTGSADIVFITGVGMVYPYVRAHTLLETLQGRIDDCPLILFYPGTFARSSAAGSTMTLFGQLPASNYYRAKSLREMTAKS